MTTRVRSLVALAESFGADTFSVSGDVVTCNACLTSLTNPRKFTLEQHVKTNKHKESLRLKEVAAFRMEELRSAAETGSRRSPFYVALCEALVKADIPFEKLLNDAFKNFLETWTSQHVPAPTTLRDAYVPAIYEEVVENIRQSIGANQIWISIDETTDSAGRYVANVIVGELSSDGPRRSFLLACENLQATNSTTIAQLFCNSLLLLWRGQMHHDRVLLFVTDAAPYMKKAARTLGGLFPKMCHSTCVAHGLHRVAEHVRALFPKVDLLIASMKKIFLKAPARSAAFQSALNIPLPPSPVITRWGSWVEAAVYYANHFEVLNAFVAGLDAEEAMSIATAQGVFKEPSLESDLAAITSAFGTLPLIIMELESSDKPLVESVTIISDFRRSVAALSSEHFEGVRRKCWNVFEQNHGFQRLILIAQFLHGDTSMEAAKAVEGYSADDISRFKHAPVVSVEVERSFSMYKAFFRDNRRAFEFENMKKYVVALCNQ